MSFRNRGLAALSLFVALSAFANPALIRDVEGLRNTLSLKDPSWPTLTLRLADLYFDEATTLSADPVAPPETLKLAERHRRKAVGLYKDAISGGGFHQPVTGVLALKIQFQLARLHSDLNEQEKALPIWNELVKQTDLPDIRREAALRLAEHWEKAKTRDATKEADKYYRLAIELCGGGDVCSYAQYRRAWLLREGGDVPAAIEVMKLALVDSKGQVREEALRDLVLFLSEERSDGKKALELIETLEAKLARPTLVDDLSVAFFAAGNRQGGVLALERANNKTPRLNQQVRLLEEYYGLRQWDKFREMLSTIDATPGALPAQDDSRAGDAEKILRRLIVQLDGERVSQAQLAGDFKSAVKLHLKLYPEGKDRFTLIEGWLAAETDAPSKVDQIKHWLMTEKGLGPKEQVRLRELRAALAAKEKNYPVVIEEMNALVALDPKGAKAREYRFTLAAAHLEKKETAEALVIFKELAAPANSPDQWAVRSQAYALELLGKNKDYAGLLAQAALWTDAKSPVRKPTPSKELATKLQAWADLAEEAEFESAVALGQTPAALATFHGFCMADKHRPKSCDNTKVLAVKLADQAKLLDVLKIQNSQDELAAEYEASGYFASSAELTEKTLPKSGNDLKPALKVALLYELGGKNADRDRLLAVATQKFAAGKSSADEALLYETLKDANLLTVASLKLPWSAPVKNRLAERLQAAGKGTPETKKLLLGTLQQTGPAWGTEVLASLKELDTQQRKIGFVGKNSQKKFEQRLAALKQFTAQAEKYYPGADTTTRIEIALLLERAHEDLAQTVLGTAIPAGLDPEQEAQVKAAIAEMAAPFTEKAGQYQSLARESVAAIASPSERAGWEAKIGGPAAGAPVAVAGTTPAPAAGPTPEVAAATAAPHKPVPPLKDSLAVLHGNPNAQDALESIRAHYEQLGQKRLASYFQGRLLQLRKEGGTP